MNTSVMRRESSSISRRLIMWLAVPLMLLSLVGALVHYFNNVAPSVISSDHRLRDAANLLMAHIRVRGGIVELDDLSVLPTRLKPSDAVIYAVRDANGRLLAGDARLPIIAMNGDTSQLPAIIPVDHQNLRSLTTRFDTAGGIALITVADLGTATEPAARYGLLSTLLWDFVQLDVTLVLVWVGIQLGLRPVKRLQEEIAARSSNDLKPLDESSVPRELAPMVVTLNRLFATLRSSVQSQQQFIANTAHQLRTPITGLKVQLDLLTAEAAASPLHDRLVTLQDGIQQLAHSANQLLSLARADPNVNIAAKTRVVDLRALAGDVAARFFDRALLTHIDLGIEAEPASILADPALIDDLISNLVDNALKYTPVGGRVTVHVSAEATDTTSCIAVEDNGGGIPEAERQRVRQRFYRLPNSPGHGSGLGLAIVDEIAHLYGGVMTIDSAAAGKGTKISVRFPAAAPGSATAPGSTIAPAAAGSAGKSAT